MSTKPVIVARIELRHVPSYGPKFKRDLKSLVTAAYKDVIYNIDHGLSHHGTTLTHTIRQSQDQITK